MKTTFRLRTLLTAAISIAALTAGQLVNAQTAAVSACSIVARDPATGDLGIAVQSRILAVGSIVPWASATAGALVTQALANTAYGPDGLRMLGYGWTAAQALDSLLAGDPDRESRQVAIVDRTGGTVAFTGSGCQAYAGQC
jgi:uncharacterized Ntn-hydrolase superfamily protein